MGTNGYHNLIDEGSLCFGKAYFGKALALAGLLIATNTRGEGQGTPNPSNAVASRPSSDPRLGSPLRDSVTFREFVFTSTKQDSELQVRELNGWRLVCVGSCRTQAVVGASYRVSGTGVPTSNEFSVRDAPDPLSIRARAGSTAEQVAGATMITVGALSLPAAFFLLIVGSCRGDCPGANQAERDSAATARQAVLPVLLGGMVTAAVGVAFFIDGGTTLDVHWGEKARVPHLHVGRSLELTPTGFAF